MVSVDTALYEFKYAIKFDREDYCTTPGEVVLLLQELQEYREMGMTPSRARELLQRESGELIQQRNTEGKST